jgi:hypothetical protein
MFYHKVNIFNFHKLHEILHPLSEISIENKIAKFGLGRRKKMSVYETLNHNKFSMKIVLQNMMYTYHVKQTQSVLASHVPEPV